ncbi:uncharacterized protein LOC127793574 isoform X2 [Diospyros lotus]|uniref:uncharacterized protein LOC127793574 isoform X2 n=1 Tax=Diospyros lotus TaxID=55363 RepID=UPI00225B6CF0|nr:uncharacterized protein LOC127793574 isoform X2 [Diospyros lotus]
MWKWKWNVRLLLLHRFPILSSATNSSLPFSFYSRRGVRPGISDGLNWALAGKGVIVMDKAFRNLTPSELGQKGATISESLSGFPFHVRGSVLGRLSEIPKAQFSKLLQQVTVHLSSVPNIFVHDGAIGSLPKCDVKVRIISDGPSPVLSLSSVLWEIPTRAVSHDSCPVTIYCATSISPSAGNILGLGAQGNNGFIVADVERSSLILCGKAFCDVKGTKDALCSLSGPIISSRGGLPLPAGLLVSANSVVLLFAPEVTMQSCLDLLVSRDGVILSSEGVSPLFQSRISGKSYLSKLPDAIIFVSSDCSGTIPSASRLSPGQAAFHFLAGYQNGTFLPAYSKDHLPINPLELAKAFLSKIKYHQISSFLINVHKGEKQIAGKDRGKRGWLNNKLLQVHHIQKTNFKALIVQHWNNTPQVSSPSCIFLYPLCWLKKVDKSIWILLPEYLGKDLIELVLSTISNNVPPFEPKGGDLQGKYKTFLCSKFPELPDEFSF